MKPLDLGALLVIAALLAKMKPAAPTTPRYGEGRDPRYGL